MLELPTSSASVASVLPPAADLGLSVKRVALIIGLTLLVVIQRPSIHELSFVAAHILLLVLAGRRSPLLARAIARRPSVHSVA